LAHAAVDITKFAAELAYRTDPNCAVYLSLIELEVFVTGERRLCDFTASTMPVSLQSTQLLPGYVLFNYATLSDAVISVDYTYSVERRDCW